MYRQKASSLKKGIKLVENLTLFNFWGPEKIEESEKHRKVCVIVFLAVTNFGLVIQ